MPLYYNFLHKFLKKGRKTLFDYSITVFTRGLSRLFALLITIIIARSLSTEDFGLYSLFFGIFILIFQAEAGLNIAYVRYAKLNIISKDNLLRLSLSAQIILLIFLLLAGWPLSIFIGSTIGIDDIRITYYGFIASGLLGLYGVWFGVYQAEGKFTFLGVLSLLFNLLLMIYIWMLYLSGMDIDIDVILYAYLTFSAALGGIAFFLLLARSTALKDREIALEFYRMIALNILVTLLYFVYRYIDVYFLKYYSDLETVAIYSAAMKTSMVLSILTGSLPTILLPKAVDAITSKNLLLSYVKKSFALCMLISLFFIVFLFLSPFILGLLFGEEYLGATFVMQLLIIGWIINTFYIPVAQIFYALNKLGWRISIEVIKLALTVIFFMILIPEFGANGAAYSLIASIAISMIIAVIVSTQLVRQHYTTST